MNSSNYRDDDDEKDANSSSNGKKIIDSTEAIQKQITCEEELKTELSDDSDSNSIGTFRLVF